MGKKKKAAKVTGTADVVKFKTTNPHFKSIEAIVVCHETLPHILLDTFTGANKEALYKFFAVFGALADLSKTDSDKAYRFQMYYRLLYPTPQYYPAAYKVSLIEQAREITDRPSLKYNGATYAWKDIAEDYVATAHAFLEKVDKLIFDVVDLCKKGLPNFDADGGLKRYREQLKLKMTLFDEAWVTYEKYYLSKMDGVYDKIFHPIAQLVQLDSELTRQEDSGDAGRKQLLESEFCRVLETLYNVIEPPDKGEPDNPTWREHTVPLAEAAVFYESKCSEEYLNLAKHVIKAYIELRMYVSKIRLERVHPQFTKNETLCRLTKNMRRAVFDAEEVLAFCAGLPVLKFCKRDGWMSRDILEPEVLEINAQDHAVQNMPPLPQPIIA